MHTVRLLLATTRYDETVIEKRFHAISHIHNVIVKHAQKRLKRLSYDAEYQSLKAEYKKLLKKDTLSIEEKTRRKLISRQMAEIIRTHGLSEYAFQSYIKVCGKQFRKCLSSQQIQKEATRVWKGVEAVLYGNGKELHFKKYRDFHTICGKTNTNGAKFQKESCSIQWLGLNIKCKLPKDQDYLLEALDSEISYCEMARKMFPNGWHYYVVVYLKGDAPHKIKAVGRDDVAGIDIGTSTVACVSSRSVTLQELAPKCREYNQKIERLLRRMDRSKRILNPNKYRADGTIEPANHEKWKFSKAYRKNQNRLKSLYRQKAAYVKQSHEETINRLLHESVCFIVEDMSFTGLQRKKKTTERRDQVSGIKQKDGSAKRIHKYKRRKRFGKSITDRAPASFVTILEQKAKLYGGNVSKVSTKEYKASQYDHAKDQYIKTDLSVREKIIAGHKVQRDLYSAFLLRNSNQKLNKPDQKKCIYEFDRFVKLQDQLIEKMKENNISMKQCFGF